MYVADARTDFNAFGIHHPLALETDTEGSVNQRAGQKIAVPGLVEPLDLRDQPDVPMDGTQE